MAALAARLAWQAPRLGTTRPAASTASRNRGAGAGMAPRRGPRTHGHLHGRLSALVPVGGGPVLGDQPLAAPAPGSARPARRGKPTRVAAGRELRPALGRR